MAAPRLGRRFSIEKRETTAKGICTSPEQREKEVDWPWPGLERQRSRKNHGFTRKTSSRGREACELEHPGSLGKEGLRRVRRLLMYFEIQNR